MSNYNFKVPERAINTPRDLEAFKESSALKEIMAFVKTCAESVIGLKASHVSGSVCEVVSKYEEFIGKLEDLVAQTPPLTQPGRFGNKAFRSWHAAMVRETEVFLDALLPEGELKGAALELTPYITGAFGNETRIDYGTGHELCFAVFFLCVFKLKLITQADFPVVILRGFTAYLRLMRLLQDTYMLEPAGSHGVWGLDDYHCLLFLWGSAQLCKQGGGNDGDGDGDGGGDGDADRDGVDSTVLSPRSIHDQELLEEYVFCSIFPVCDVSLSLSIYITACLYSLTPHNTSLTTTLPHSITNRRNTHITYHLTGTHVTRPHTLPLG